MRFAACLALLFTTGCLRFGYQAHAPTDHGRDAGSQDAGSAAAVGGNGGRSGSGALLDAGSPDSNMDAQTPPDMDAAVDAGAMTSMDAGGGDAAATMSDAAMSDAAARDASASDAAISDAGPDAWVGSGLLCPPDAKFCDGYENSDFTKTWDYSILTSGTATQSTSLVHAGAGSLHAKTGAAHGGTTTNSARWGKRLYAHQTSGDVWARWYYYVPSSTSVTTFFSAGVIAEIEEPYFGFALIVRKTRIDIGVGDDFYPGTTTFPRDRWVCVELHALVADAPSGVFEAYLDGELAVQATGVNTLPNMGYTSLDVGIHYTDPSQGPVEAYADDVAAGTTRIGCVP